MPTLCSAGQSQPRSMAAPSPRMRARCCCGKPIAACFTDGRDQEQVEHTLETLIAQRVHGVALGYEDLNDNDTAASL